MIKNFFLTLNQSKIEYMLISGQATVLYGAATFSEDIDLWVAPDADNWQKFVQALQKLEAKVYKLTPPIKPKFIQKGHGFHFEFLPADKGNVWFLDVMGIVPRVICDTLPRKCLMYCLKAIKGADKEGKYFPFASKEIALEIEEFRREDRNYWQTIIDELKVLSRKGKLLNMGDKPE